MLLRPEVPSLQTALQARSPFAYRVPTPVATTPTSAFALGTEFTAQRSDQVGALPTAITSIQESGLLAQVPPQPVEPRVTDEPDINRFAGRGVGSEAAKHIEPLEEVRAAPIEVWEGEVKAVDMDNRVMQVRLTSKVGKAPDHTGEIDLEWVAQQDLDLVRPGAVFYWSIYKETRHGTVRNSQELRFRRLPSWSKQQIQKIRAEAQELLKNPKVGRVAT